jgi:putative inorganic carbon (hco3(-)) transporter
MRDLLLGGILLWIVLLAWRKPWIGVLGWTWVGIMNPHQLSWQLQSAPVAAAIAGSTLLGLFISQDRKNFFLVRENALLLLFMLWMSITLPFSLLYEESVPMYDRVMKINLFILLSMVVFHSKRHILLLTWVVVLSLAYYGVKGGIFTALTGGNYRVWGPSNTYIEGNNELALALVMTIPLMRFLQTTLTSKWGSRAMTFSMICLAAAALGSHSRGALLAIVAMAVVLWWRSPKKVLGLVGFLVVGAALLSIMPEHWWSRMETIQTYEQDDSALGRINAWKTAYEVAKARITGGGYFMWTLRVFAVYSPDPHRVHAAHSIYFMVLGEQGFIGLFLFLSMWFCVFFKLGKIRKLAAKQAETRWLAELGSMGQVSLVGYAVGGAFLSLSYWDMPYNILVLAVVGLRWIENKEWLREKPNEPLIVLPAFLANLLPSRPKVRPR